MHNVYRTAGKCKEYMPLLAFKPINPILWYNWMNISEQYECHIKQMAYNRHSSHMRATSMATRSSGTMKRGEAMAVEALATLWKSQQLTQLPLYYLAQSQFTTQRRRQVQK